MRGLCCSTQPKMANGTKFRLNRYNWLGQKLLAQHQYTDIIRLRNCLVKGGGNDSSSDDGVGGRRRWPISEHLIYVNSLAMMKTSTHLDEVIFALQRLNFDKSRQHFLLLCQCLLYLGNYDSVVALCKQVINKEIDSVELKREDSFTDKSLIDFSTSSTEPHLPGNSSSATKPRNGLDWTQTEALQESVEFKRVLASINKNKLINEPRLWFIFGICLEYQQQYKSAHFAFEVAAKLATNHRLDTSAERQDRANLIGGQVPVAMSYYYAPHTCYAERCVNNKADYRGAIQLLSQIARQLPPNFTVHPLMALILSSQPNANESNFSKAIEIISSLEIHSASNRNPSLIYNQLALKCARKLGDLYQPQLSSLKDHIPEIGDLNRSCLGYLLARSYIILNSLVQNCDKNSHLFKYLESDRQVSDSGSVAANNLLNETVDRLAFALRNSNPSCWSSAALWNNLGLCYLSRKRFIASLSCLLKALQLNPLDWRINYNMALACVHVNLFSRAILCLLAARNLYTKKQSRQLLLQTNCENRMNPLITSLLAVCYDCLGEEDEARRLHIEVTRALEATSAIANPVPVMSILNYLIFLDKERTRTEDQECSKVILHLLDQLEQRWLQRDQHDPQFNLHLLDVASRVGERAVGQSRRGCKTYAWTKHASDFTAGQ